MFGVLIKIRLLYLSMLGVHFFPLCTSSSLEISNLRLFHHYYGLGRCSPTWGSSAVAKLQVPSCPDSCRLSGFEGSCSFETVGEHQVGKPWSRKNPFKNDSLFVKIIRNNELEIGRVSF